MKKAIMIGCLMVASILSGKAFGQERMKWIEQDKFHATAMSSFHAAEMNKLQPARDSAAVILKLAQQWQEAAVPAGYDAAVLKPLLQKLVDECKALYEAADSKRPDAVLRPLVMKAHNTFHAILSKTR